MLKEKAPYSPQICISNLWAHAPHDIVSYREIKKAPLCSRNFLPVYGLIEIKTLHLRLLLFYGISVKHVCCKNFFSSGICLFLYNLVLYIHPLIIGAACFFICYRQSLKFFDEAFIKGNASFFQPFIHFDIVHLNSPLYFSIFLCWIFVWIHYILIILFDQLYFYII